MIDLRHERIVEAGERARGEFGRTPVIRSAALGEASGAEVFLKLENLLEPVGSFKLRGAFNRMSSLTDEEKRRGVVTASAGNHGQAVAYCASRAGVDATVFMPVNAPKIKVENVGRFGARARLEGLDYDDSERLAHEFERETGRVFIHPFYDAAVMAGQGTVALELMEQTGGADVLIVPVGGGGLACGCAVAAKAVNPRVRVIGVQPETSAPFVASKKAGRRVETPIGDSLADALTGEIIADDMFELFDSLVDEAVAVSEAALADAVYMLLKRHGIAVEGGGAAGVAALLGGIPGVAGKRVAVVVTGRGIDPAALAKIIREKENIY